jgi:hypothetical protein
MELDDMKLAWQALGRRMEQQYALDFTQYREARVRKARRQLLPLQGGLLLRMGFGVALIVLAARFWVSQLGVPHLVLCGALVHAYGVLLVLTACIEWSLLLRIDYAAPVLDLQRGLEKLRVFRIRTLPMWIVTGCLWWVPMTVIALRWLGIDLWLRAPTALAWLLASGVAALAGFWAVWRWLPGAVVSLQRDAVGASLERSRRFLDEIERFERG